MRDIDRKRAVGQMGARFGMFLSALIVFGCGWLAMSTSDWKRIVVLTALALVAGVVASQFARRSR